MNSDVINLETAIEKIALIRKKLHRSYLESQVLCGITNLDEILSGFDTRKIYTLISNSRELALEVGYGLADNIDILYQTNYSILLEKNESGKTPDDIWQYLLGNQLFSSHKEVMSYKGVKRPSLIHKPILFIGNINGLSYKEIQEVIKKSRGWWHREVLVIFLYVLEGDNTFETSIYHIPKEIEEHSDVIISLEENELKKKKYYKEIEATLIKNYKPELSRTTLFFNQKSNRLTSILKN